RLQSLPAEEPQVGQRGEDAVARARGLEREPAGMPFARIEDVGRVLLGARQAIEVAAVAHEHGALEVRRETGLVVIDADRSADAEMPDPPRRAGNGAHGAMAEAERVGIEVVGVEPATRA